MKKYSCFLKTTIMRHLSPPGGLTFPNALDYGQLTSSDVWCEMYFTNWKVTNQVLFSSPRKRFQDKYSCFLKTNNLQLFYNIKWMIYPNSLVTTYSFCYLYGIHALLLTLWYRRQDFSPLIWLWLWLRLQPQDKSSCLTRLHLLTPLLA